MTAVRGARPAVMEIAEFSETLKEGQIRAVDVAPDQVEIEGAPFWLCRLMGDGFQTSARLPCLSAARPSSRAITSRRSSGTSSSTSWVGSAVIDLNRKSECCPCTPSFGALRLVSYRPVGHVAEAALLLLLFLILPKSECSGIMEYAAIDEFEFSEET